MKTIKNYSLATILLLAFFTAQITFAGMIPDKYENDQKSSKIIITGVVVDANQKPVKDAVIVIDGKKTKSSTDNKGFYKISVKPSAEKIGIFTFVSSISEEAINGRTTIDFVIDEIRFSSDNYEKDDIGEEEINVGYGTSKRKNLSNKVGKIDGMSDKFASYNTIYDMIRGEVSGVYVVNKSIRVRGAGSLYSSIDPLFIVDGISVTSIDNISPQTVRSIELLKGSAAAIYGSRGANGVFLINTKGSKDTR